MDILEYYIGLSIFGYIELYKYVRTVIKMKFKSKMNSSWTYSTNYVNCLKYDEEDYDYCSYEKITDQSVNQNLVQLIKPS